jgi:hypothetical protein
LKTEQKLCNLFLKIWVIKHSSALFLHFNSSVFVWAYRRVVENLDIRGLADAGLDEFALHGVEGRVLPLAEDDHVDVAGREVQPRAETPKDLHLQEKTIVYRRYRYR